MVDDDAAKRDLIGSYLERKDFQVSAAAATKQIASSVLSSGLTTI